MFITDAVLNGLPPHIAQVIAGHHDINVTLGYKAVYPEEAIAAHRAFLARRLSSRLAGTIRWPASTAPLRPWTGQWPTPPAAGLYARPARAQADLHLRSPHIAKATMPFFEVTSLFDPPALVELVCGP